MHNHTEWGNDNINIVYQPIPEVDNVVKLTSIELNQVHVQCLANRNGQARSVASMQWLKVKSFKAVCNLEIAWISLWL